MLNFTPRLQAWSFGLGLSATALVLSVLNLGLNSTSKPTLSLRHVNAVPTNPWSTSWTAALPLSVQTASPSLHWPRPVTLRGMTDGRDLCLLVEWVDETPDMGFEGAYYPSWINSPRAMVQESTLLRDELDVWFGPVDAASPYYRALSNDLTHGHWAWRSQRQTEKDRNFIAMARKEFGTPYVNYYPIQGDGAFAARYVGNTNAITASPKACEWVARPAKDVYTQPLTKTLDGEGRWNQGTWRVMFKVPLASLEAISQRLELVLRLSDGGLGERKAECSITQPLVLDLNSWKQGVQNP